MNKIKLKLNKSRNKEDEWEILEEDDDLQSFQDGGGFKDNLINVGGEWWNQDIIESLERDNRLENDKWNRYINNFGVVTSEEFYNKFPTEESFKFHIGKQKANSLGSSRPYVTPDEMLMRNGGNTGYQWSNQQAPSNYTLATPKDVSVSKTEENPNLLENKGIGKYSKDIIDYIPPTVYNPVTFFNMLKNSISPNEEDKITDKYIETPSTFEIDGEVYNTSLKGDRDAQLLNQGFPQKYNTFEKYKDSTNTYKIKDYDRQKLLDMYFEKANILKNNREHPYDKYIDNKGNIKTLKENLSTILFGSPLEKEQEIYDKTKKLLLRDDINGTLYPNKNAFGIMQNFTAKDNPEANPPFINTYDQLDYDLKFSEHPFLAPIQRGLDGIFPQNRFQIRDTIYYDPETLKYKPKLKLTKKQSGGKIKTDLKGYWNKDNHGKPVRIPSNRITMKGVNQPLLGISDTGDIQMMYPNQDYQFDGSSVTELPIKRYGGSTQWEIIE